MAALPIHPADELAYLRAEMRRLQVRATALEDQLASGHVTDLDGMDFRAVVSETVSHRLDAKRLPEAIRHDPRYMVTRVARAVRLVRRREADFTEDDAVVLLEDAA